MLTGPTDLIHTLTVAGLGGYWTLPISIWQVGIFFQTPGFFVLFEPIKFPGLKEQKSINCSRDAKSESAFMR